MNGTRTLPSPFTWGLLAVAIVPVAVLLGLRWVEPTELSLVGIDNSFRRFEASPIAWSQQPLGPEPRFRPRITYLDILDFDQDGIPDVLACDAQRQRVFWYRQAPRGRWTELPLGDEIAAPCHVAVTDLDGDGDRDVVVASLGSVWPTNDLVGRVVWLENTGEHSFRTHVLLDHLRRVTDVQPGDLDGDGDMDLVVAEFGYDQGRLFWMENRGKLAFRQHDLRIVQGSIHVPLADYDGDGDLDIIALFSQDEEEVWAFENRGNQTFLPRVLFSSPNFDLGTAGLVRTDLDQDGKEDLLLVAGDNLEIQYPQPQAWHGCIWLKNQGGWGFDARRLSHFGGCYAASAGDVDGDGDRDVILVSMFNEWRLPDSASVVWLQNDGENQFKTWQVADHPTHLAAVACGDLDGDGRAEVVAGGFHLQGPFDRIGRITLWTPGKEAGR